MRTPMTIPTVDLSPFFIAGDESGREKAKESITKACTDYGYSDEIKRKCSSNPGAPLPAGYNKQPEQSPDKNEYLLMFPPESVFNILPNNPLHFR
ncbi:hypothetical protein Ccrd_024474 [Cynara cardunculus var. scolymus]|uniref:Uncharacterized protein n=1 Tax=Cynara cardunculus var. scolymus TaxID=59895 RepID=A0A103XCD5_CYNCS|nr:hypothetical protein Ccrd_024474 [Cynara cardunculus var. scolymus]